MPEQDSPLTPEQELSLINSVEEQRKQQEMSDPTSGMTTGEKVLAGAGRGLLHTAHVVGNYVPGLNKQEGFRDEDLAQAKDTDAPLLDTTAGKVGNFIGETAATLPLSGVGGRAVSLLGKYGSKIAPSLRALTGNGALARYAGMGAEGAVQGAVTSDPGEQGAGAAMGAGAGMLLPAALSGSKFLAKGMSRTPEAQALLDRGVDLTPGQMKPGGIWSSLEEKAQALPVIGKVLENQRGNARTQLQQKVIQDVAPPHAADPTHMVVIDPAHPNDMMKDIQTAYKSAWDDMDQTPLNKTSSWATPNEGKLSTERLPGTLHDSPPGQTISPKIGGNTIDEIPTREALKRTLDAGINPYEFPRVSPSDLSDARHTVTNLKGMLDNMGDDLTVGDLRKVRQYAKDAKREAFAAGNGDLGSMWRAIDQRMTQFGVDALDPATAAHFQNLDRQYARYKVVEDAVARAKDRPSGFTPHELSSAVSHATSQGDIAGGGGLLRDWSKPFADVFSQREARTGLQTAGLLTAEGLAGAGAVANPPVAATLGAAVAAPYTSAGRHFLQGKTLLNKTASPLNTLLQGANKIQSLRHVALNALRTGNPLPAMVGSAQPAKAALEQKYDQATTGAGNLAHRLFSAPPAPVPQPPEQPQMAGGGKVETVMHEWKQGKLHSGSKQGPVVHNQKQAVAIALSEQRKAKMADGGKVDAAAAFRAKYPAANPDYGTHRAWFGGRMQLVSADPDVEARAVAAMARLNAMDSSDSVRKQTGQAVTPAAYRQATKDKTTPAGLSQQNQVQSPAAGVTPPAN